MSGYRQGRAIEYAVIHDLSDNGYVVVRAAGSKGAADIVAIKTRHVLFVNVKRQRLPSPNERAALLALATLLPGVGIPLIATKPPGRGIQYRRLLSVRPVATTPWDTNDWGK